MPVSLEQSNTDLGHFSSLHEIALTKLYGGQPLFVTHYPTQEVAFYHAVKSGEEDVVLNADLLAPGYGEIIGSGERIIDPQALVNKIERFEMQRSDYEWYIDLKMGQLYPNAGFGMGIERFITWLLKLDSVDGAIAYPRIKETYVP